MWTGLRVLSWLALVSVFASSVLAAVPSPAPNILLIYGDDIGYGDFGCYGAVGVQTPNVDRVAREGLRFSNAYASSATCTPSRYSLLTGEYAWRKKGTGVLAGDAGLIIEPGRVTLPSLLQKAGYATAVVGKWHLGLGAGKESLDWNVEIKPGPREIGFDYSFIMPATGDRVPCVYVENGRVVGLDPADPIQVSYGKPFPGEPTGLSARDTLKLDWSHGHNATIVNGISRIGHMTGGKSALWKDEDMADTYVRHAVAFIEQSRGKPFFLYFATHDIHVPRVPHPRFVGQTGMGARGDAIVQFDWCVGELLRTLDRLKLTKNTLVVLTSDNGPVLDDGYKDAAVEKVGAHKPAGPLRGGKYSLFEGGTRVPFLVRWPGRVQSGQSDALISQIDFVASFAALTKQTLPSGAAPDSVNFLPALLGESKTGREQLVEHAGRLAIREGAWKYLEPGKGPARSTNTNTELGNLPKPQLYDVKNDPAERQNVAEENPEKASALAEALKRIRAAGRRPEQQ